MSHIHTVPQAFQAALRDARAWIGQHVNAPKQLLERIDLALSTPQFTPIVGAAESTTARAVRRDADYRRYGVEFNIWLDESVSDDGTTVWDTLADVSCAYAGWISRTSYVHPLTQPPQPATDKVIALTPAEIQSKFSRVKWAEGLIKQLPADHEGRNSWLMNYGSDGIHIATSQSAAHAEEQQEGPFTNWPNEIQSLVLNVREDIATLRAGKLPLSIMQGRAQSWLDIVNVIVTSLENAVEPAAKYMLAHPISDNGKKLLVKQTAHKNMLYLTHYDAEGINAGTWSSTSPNAREESSYMTGFIELERAARLRNVPFKPHKIGGVWVSSAKPDTRSGELLAALREAFAASRL